MSQNNFSMPKKGLFPKCGVLRGLNSSTYDEYASSQTLVRPCLSKKLLIYASKKLF